MIKDIKEVNFPSYATLSAATVSLSDMGERVITAQVKIDGGIVPDFSFDWIVEFKGERYIHPIRKPQAVKENTSLYSTIDLTFRHWAEYEMSRYYFVEMTSIESGTAIADKYIASLSLTLGDFIEAFNRVLDYYYGGKITAQLNPQWQYAQEPTTINISYTYIWDVLIKMYDNYGVRWQLTADPTDGDKCIIRFGYPSVELDHIFEYGFQGGLLKVERQVQSSDIRNILLGRGGDKNIPYRYYKDTDPNNDSFEADPDWIPELRNIYFAELRDAAFRSYVQGWKARHYEGQTTKEKAYVDWAWEKGYTDDKFEPIEVAKDDTSIAKYGELWGGLENNEDIFPTIQGVIVMPHGRIDQVVDVERISSDDAEDQITDAEESYIYVNSTASAYDVPKWAYTTLKFTIPGTFKIPEGKHGNIYVDAVSYTGTYSTGGKVDNALIVPMLQTQKLVVYDTTTGTQFTNVGLPAGTYRAEYSVEVQNSSNRTQSIHAVLKRLRQSVSSISSDKAPNTFDIWVKNIWGTSKRVGESDLDYAERVWTPILGDRSGDTAKVVFSTGFLSISEDYEFEIANIAQNPQYDTSKTFFEKDKDGNIIGSYKSEWKITLVKSEAEIETTGLLLPNTQINAQAGDYFFFTGIDMPHQYVVWAEERLYDYKKDQLAEVSDIKPTWIVSLDKVRIVSKQGDEASTLLSQLELGASLRLTDSRFIREEGKVYEILYLQSITYSYQEPSSGASALTPDVEIVLSNSYATTANPISSLQGEISALAKQVGSISNIEQLVRNVGDKTYLRKDGISDISHSPTRFEKQIIATKIRSSDFSAGTNGYQIDTAGNAELLSLVVRSLLRSPSFVDGLLGSGWQLEMDASGISHLAVDRLTVRQTMRVLEILVEKVRSVGGELVVSAADGKVAGVDMDATGQHYLLTFEMGCPFVAGDLVRCKVEGGAASKSYWVEIDSVEGGVAAIAASEFGDALPAVGDECVLMGNTTDPQRQGLILISATDDGQPRIDVMSGVNGKTLAGCLHARMGNLDGIADSWFPADDQPRGYGLYADNAYLRGRFLLTTGEDVATKFEVMEGTIRSSIESMRNDFTTGQSFLNNPNFGSGMRYWDSNNDIAFFTLGGKYLWVNGAPYSNKGSYAGVEYVDGRTVMCISNNYILQKNADFKTRPAYEPGLDGLLKAKPVFLTFFYKCTEPGTLNIEFEDVDQTGFQNFQEFRISQEIAAGEGYRTFEGSGLWNGTGDFKLSFSGKMYLYMLMLNLDHIEDFVYSHRTLFEQTDLLVKIATESFDKNGNLINTTGLVSREDVTGLYAIAGDGTLQSFVGASAEGVFIKAGSIKLEGLVTANENFKILEDGSIEAKNGVFRGQIEATSGTIGGFEIGQNRIGAAASQSGDGGGLSIYNDFFRVGGEQSYVMFGDNVIPASSGGAFSAAGRIVNCKPNSGAQWGYDTANYGLLIDVTGGTKNYGIQSNAPLAAPAFINTAIYSWVMSGDAYQIDFSQASVYLIYAEKNYEVTLPDESSVAGMFSRSVLPDDFGALVTFKMRPGSKTITLKGVYGNASAGNIQLKAGDSITLLISKIDGFRYIIINRYTY